MRQRVMIAMALSCEPKLLIADEPTTALDVTIQAQILELIRTVQEETGAALMLITHDLGVVAEMVNDVVVMYAGRVVERGTRRRGPARSRSTPTPRACSLDPVEGQARPAPERHQGHGPQPVQHARRAATSRRAARTPSSPARSTTRGSTTRTRLTSRAGCTRRAPGESAATAPAAGRARPLEANRS